MPLKVSDGIGAWIKDFKSSRNSRFKGKSPEKRRDQAIAAYLSARRDQKENYVSDAQRKAVWASRNDKKKNEATNEKPPFDGPYKKKQSVVPGKHGEGPSTAKHLAKQGMKQAEKKPVKEGLQPGWMLKKDPELAKKVKDKVDLAKKRQATYGDKSAGKSVKEVSTNTLTNYLKKASPTVDAAKERLPGIKRALNKLDQKTRKEETVNELDKSTLQSYKDKTKSQIGTLKKVSKTMSDPAHKAPWERGIGVRSKGLERAKKRLGEDVNESEQLDELSPDLLGRYVRKRGSLNITKKQSKMKSRAHELMRDKTKNLPAIAGKYSNPADVSTATYSKYKKKESTNEATTFEVDIEGLPKMYIKDKSPGAVKAKLRGIVKQPSMIQGVDRVTDAEMKKTYRDKAQGRDEIDEVSGAMAQRYHDKAVKTPLPADKKTPEKALKRFAGMMKAQDRIHRDELKRIGGQK